MNRLITISLLFIVYFNNSYAAPQTQEQIISDLANQIADAALEDRAYERIRQEGYAKDARILSLWDNLPPKTPMEASLLQSQRGQKLKEKTEKVREVVTEDISHKLAHLIAECSYYAAHPDDSGKYGKGVAFSKINAVEAIATCTEAYNGGGNKIGLVLTALSRAYNKAEKYQQSFGYAKAAAAVDYPYGYLLVGTYYFLGDGVDKDMKQMFLWHKKAAEKGLTLGMRSTAENYVKGDGVTQNFDEALFWAKKAIMLGDGKAYYSLGLTLENMGKGKGNSSLFNKAAKEAYEIAGANVIDTKEDIARINKVERPNRIAQANVLSHPTIKGTKVGGVFVLDEADITWYMGDKALEMDGNKYVYARTSHQGSTFTVWYQHSSDPSQSGWYVDFYYALGGAVQEFTKIRVTKDETPNNKTRYLNLDLSDPKVQELDSGYRLTAGITFRDLNILRFGDSVDIYYKRKGKEFPSSYGLPLNDDDFQGGADAIFTELNRAALNLNEGCCEELNPNTIPFSKVEFLLFDACKDDVTHNFSLQEDFGGNCVRPKEVPFSTEKFMKFFACEDDAKAAKKARERFLKQNRVRQDCGLLMKNNHEGDLDLMVKPLQKSLTRYMGEVERLTGGQ